MMEQTHKIFQLHEFTLFVGNLLSNSGAIDHRSQDVLPSLLFEIAPVYIVNGYLHLRLGGLSSEQDSQVFNAYCRSW